MDGVFDDLNIKVNKLLDHMIPVPDKITPEFYCDTVILTIEAAIEAIEASKKVRSLVDSFVNVPHAKPQLLLPAPKSSQEPN